MCSSGVSPVRGLQRAQILLSLEQGIQDQLIASVLQVERTYIWRVKQRYLQGDLLRGAEKKNLVKGKSNDSRKLNLGI
jgi:hypothetical protein